MHGNVSTLTRARASLNISLIYVTLWLDFDTYFDREVHHYILNRSDVIILLITLPSASIEVCETFTSTSDKCSSKCVCYILHKSNYFIIPEDNHTLR